METGWRASLWVPFLQAFRSWAPRRLSARRDLRGMASSSAVVLKRLIERRAEVCLRSRQKRSAEIFAHQPGGRLGIYFSGLLTFSGRQGFYRKTSEAEWKPRDDPRASPPLIARHLIGRQATSASRLSRNLAEESPRRRRPVAYRPDERPAPPLLLKNGVASFSHPSLERPFHVFIEGRYPASPARGAARAHLKSRPEGRIQNESGPIFVFPLHSF
jgi:hypothetical protein